MTTDTTERRAKRARVSCQSFVRAKPGFPDGAFRALQEALARAKEGQ